jgi:DNA-binding CsgD family transcriptional regulator
MRGAHALTLRQVAIVDLVAVGRTDKDIANIVGMSYRTVRTHLERLYRLNDVHCRAALVAVITERRHVLQQERDRSSAVEPKGGDLRVPGSDDAHWWL